MDGRSRAVPKADCGDHRGALGDARRSSRLSQAGFGEGRELISNLVLGANCDDHDSVHGSRKSLGAEHWVGKKLLAASFWLNQNRFSKKLVARS